MYGAHKYSYETTLCHHEHVLTDCKEGTEVCADCGLVINAFLFNGEMQYGEKEKEKEENIEKKIKEEKETVKTLQDIWHFPDVVIYETDYLFHKVLNMKLKIGVCDAYVFAFYQALIIHKSARIPDEIAAMFHLKSVKKLSEISKLTQINALPDLHDFLHRLATNLDFSFKEKSMLSTLTDHLSHLPSIQPQSLSALIIFHFCSLTNKTIRLKEIAEKCFITISTLKKNIKKYEELRCEMYVIFNDKVSYAIKN